MKIIVIDGIEYIKAEEVILDKKLRLEKAVRALTYSEAIAAISVFKELGNSEGVIKASSVADRIRVTRSIIVQALSKLEGAGAVESKSLGAKGTHIKLLDESLLGTLQEIWHEE